MNTFTNIYFFIVFLMLILLYNFESFIYMIIIIIIIIYIFKNKYIDIMIFSQMFFCCDVYYII